MDLDFFVMIDFGCGYEFGMFDLGVVGVIGFDSGWKMEEVIC